MNTIAVFKFVLIVIAGELLIHFIFFMISKFFGKNRSDKVNLQSIFKGILERGFILVSLQLAIVAALTLFGALKIATRIQNNEDKVSNDFFLAGNLISVLFAIFYHSILNQFQA